MNRRLPLVFLSLGILLAVSLLQPAASQGSNSLGEAGALSGSPTPTASPTTDPNCQVTSIQNMSPTPNNPYPMNFTVPAYQVKINKTTSTPQIYVNGTCFSCAPTGTGAIAPDRKKNAARLTPKSDWITFDGELTVHTPYAGTTAQQQYEYNNGWYMDLWVVRPDGSAWYKLTNLVSSVNSTQPVGTLAAQFSPDQKHVTWASLVSGATSAHPIGTWQLMLADFVVDGAGVPSLQNIRDISAPNGTWFEPTSWSPDNTHFVLSADIGLQYQYGADDFVYDLTTGHFTDLTNLPLSFEEHAYYSVSGKKIAHESEYPNPVRLPAQATQNYQLWRPALRTELVIMDADGGRPMQITGANVPAPTGVPDPELTSQGVTTSGGRWNTTGNQFALPLTVINSTTGQATLASTWLITFAGACG